MLLQNRRHSFWMRLRMPHGIDRRILLLGLLFLAGVAAGASVSAHLEGETRIFAQAIAKNFFQLRPEQSMRELFFHAFLPDVALFAIIFFCGFCAVAAPLLLFLPFFKGLGFGAVCAFLLRESGFSSVKVIAFSVFPGVIWSAILLLLACRDAQRLSAGFYAAATRGTAVSTDRFCAMMLLYLLLLALGCALQAWSGFLFWGTLPQG